MLRTNRGQSFDLSLLYTVLANQRNNQDHQPSINTSHLVIIQLSILLSVLLVLLCWRYFKRVCVTKEARTEEKVSDLPPSYSTADLYSLAVSVSDHLQPPPQYLGVSCNHLNPP